MNRLMIQAVFSLSICPLLMAQQPNQSAAPSASTAAQQTADVLQSSAVVERMQIAKNARTICIKSETVFLTVSTLERALMKQKNWDQLGLNIVDNGCSADLQIAVDRLPLTHIHTYVLTDRASGVVLAAGRVRALDGVVASGPMAEQLVKVLSEARLPAQAASAERGL